MDSPPDSFLGSATPIYIMRVSEQLESTKKILVIRRGKKRTWSNSLKGASLTTPRTMPEHGVGVRLVWKARRINDTAEEEDEEEEEEKKHRDWKCRRKEGSKNGERYGKSDMHCPAITKFAQEK